LNIDVLLSDLHLPDAGDGFTVVSAMRHTQPRAVTIVISGYPALQEAVTAILLEADEVLVKPIGLMTSSKSYRKAGGSCKPDIREERARRSNFGA